MKDQGIQNILFLFFHAGRGDGDNQRIIINIHNQAGASVAFGIDQAIGIGRCVDEPLTQPKRSMNALIPESGVNSFVAIPA